MAIEPMPPAPRSCVRGVVIGLAGLVLVACGGGEAAPDSVTFAFRMRGLGPAEAFRVSTSSPAFIAQARAQLAMPAAQRRLFAAGPIRAGNGGHNLDWSWHFTRDVALAEVSIELCDGRPSMVEADLGYWLRRVGSFCPWGSYVHAEVR
ncbi:MAG: hypothetical protein K0S57_2961 [Ramlibacter sp.]|jgi:hypothetical protein|nr:hypothetical protein [Ramlibacter sp.]